MGRVFNQPKERETEAGDEGSFSRELSLKLHLESQVELAGQQKGLEGPAAQRAGTEQQVLGQPQTRLPDRVKKV